MSVIIICLFLTSAVSICACPTIR